MVPMVLYTLNVYREFSALSLVGVILHPREGTQAPNLWAVQAASSIGAIFPAQGPHRGHWVLQGCQEPSWPSPGYSQFLHPMQ